MLLNLYVVRDSKSGTVNAPVALINDAVALRHLRQVRQAFADEDRDDFSIWKVAQFDTLADFDAVKPLHFCTPVEVEMPVQIV